MDTVELRRAVNHLVELADLAGVKYVVGIPEGGLVPAYAFAVAVGLPVIFASIWKSEAPGLISFNEDHVQPSVSEKHIIGLEPGDHVIVVEDEITTGTTAINCIEALRTGQIRCDQIATIYASDDPLLRPRLASKGIEMLTASLFPQHLCEQLSR